MGRVIQRVKRASVARVRPSGPAMPVVSGRPPCGGEGSAALDVQTPPALPQPPVLCCLAASDVWVCWEVPEWALEIGHSLPGADPHVTFPVVTVSGRHSLMLSVEGQ